MHNTEPEPHLLHGGTRCSDSLRTLRSGTVGVPELAQHVIAMPEF